MELYQAFNQAQHLEGGLLLLILSSIILEILTDRGGQAQDTEGMHSETEGTKLLSPDANGSVENMKD